MLNPTNFLTNSCQMALNIKTIYPFFPFISFCCIFVELLMKSHGYFCKIDRFGYKITYNPD